MPILSFNRSNDFEKCAYANVFSRSPMKLASSRFYLEVPEGVSLEYSRSKNTLYLALRFFIRATWSVLSIILVLIESASVSSPS